MGFRVELHNANIFLENTLKRTQNMCYVSFFIDVLWLKTKIQPPNIPGRWCVEHADAPFLISRKLIPSVSSGLLLGPGREGFIGYCARQLAAKSGM